MDYGQFHTLDTYLFDTVHKRFRDQGYLSAFDFFCIVVWKANRAKSKIAKRLLEQSKCQDLDTAVRRLTEGIADRMPDELRQGLGRIPAVCRRRAERGAGWHEPA